MRLILTPEQMRRADMRAIEEWNFPSFTLMEHAARSSFDIIMREYKKELESKQNYSIAVLCGWGNNGGDGFALARMLARVAEITICTIGTVPEAAQMTPETRLNYQLARKSGIATLHIGGEEELANFHPNSYDMFIDALVGIGGAGALRPPLPALFRRLHREATAAKYIALDVPTGISAATGFPVEEGGEYFPAETVITMQEWKTGVVAAWRRGYFLQLHTASIFLPFPAENVIDEEEVRYIALQQSDVLSFVPPRPQNSNKFDYGRVLAIGGSEAMPGSIALTAAAALATGAGLVEVCTPLAHFSMPAEAIVYPMKSTPQGTISPDNAELIYSRMEKADVLVVGPGLGTSEATLLLLIDILREALRRRKQCILDADALRPLLCEALAEVLSPEEQPHYLAFLPHSGELSRLMGAERREIEPRPEEAARAAAAQYRSTVHLKVVPACTIAQNTTYISTFGNPGMATAGSGDVLAGIAAAVAAQSPSAMLATTIAGAALIHALAGDAASRHCSRLVATDIINSIKEVLP